MFKVEIMSFKKPADPIYSVDTAKKQFQYAREFAGKFISNLDLYKKLNILKNKYRFPAVDDEVGALLKTLVEMKSPKRIFEFGSGYGHSAFWYLEAESKFCNIKEIILTEKRSDLVREFENLPWPNRFLEKVSYFQGDAFEKFSSLDSMPDFILLDGQKNQYLSFIQSCEENLPSGSLIVIDNAFWKGKIVDPNDQSSSALAMKDLHAHLINSKRSLWSTSFIPLSDGVLILQKL